MGQIIRERERKTNTWYCINFYVEGEIFSSYICDEDGNFLKDKNTECAYQNYLKNITQSIVNSNIKHYIEKREQYYTENPLFRCDCGEEFELYNEYMGACECPKCHGWVNLFGQSLNSPETWKEGGDW